jgi:hypothetical protein
MEPAGKLIGELKKRLKAINCSLNKWAARAGLAKAVFYRRLANPGGLKLDEYRKLVAAIEQLEREHASKSKKSPAAR